MVQHISIYGWLAFAIYLLYLLPPFLKWLYQSIRREPGPSAEVLNRREARHARRQWKKVHSGGCGYLKRKTKGKVIFNSDSKSYELFSSSNRFRCDC